VQLLVIRILILNISDDINLNLRSTSESLPPQLITIISMCNDKFYARKIAADDDAPNGIANLINRKFEKF
jgi:hypothetical protein